jgi:hypothetical protein
MRRLSLTLIASCGIAMLTACSGGFAFNGANGNGNITTIVFTNGSGQTNDFFVAPTGNTPLQVNAIAYKGTGSGSTVVPDAEFTWAASFSKPGTTYTKGPSPSGSSTCGTPGQIVPQYYTILVQGPGSGPVPSPSSGQGVAPAAGEDSPNYLGYSLIAPFQATSTVFISPPLDPTKLPEIVPISGTNYCLQLDATHVGDGVKGSVTIVVGNSP